MGIKSVVILRKHWLLCDGGEDREQQQQRLEGHQGCKESLEGGDREFWGTAELREQDGPGVWVW